jgi:4-methyl-5(b-hydroxyethyl)-thiazole monophosphate biosynthesis
VFYFHLKDKFKRSVMKKAYIFLASGFEEIEAVGTVDYLRRGGLTTVMISMTESLTVTGSHGISVLSDELFGGTYEDGDVLILPGGQPGVDNLNSHVGLRELLIRWNEGGRLIAAICAAPMILGDLGMLKGKRATCYFGCESRLTGATIVHEIPSLIDGNIITGEGPGMVFEFGWEIVNALLGDKPANDVADALLI